MPSYILQISQTTCNLKTNIKLHVVHNLILKYNSQDKFSLSFNLQPPHPPNEKLQIEH